MTRSRPLALADIDVARYRALNGPSGALPGLTPYNGPSQLGSTYARTQAACYGLQAPGDCLSSISPQLQAGKAREKVRTAAKRRLRDPVPEDFRERPEGDGRRQPPSAETRQRISETLRETLRKKREAAGSEDEG
jgi:hypothetical protein